MEPQKGRKQELDFGNPDSRVGSGGLLVTQHGHRQPYDPQAWFSHKKAKGRNLMIQDPRSQTASPFSDSRESLGDATRLCDGQRST